MRLGSGNSRQEDRRTVELLRRLPPHILQGHLAPKLSTGKHGWREEDVIAARFNHRITQLSKQVGVGAVSQD